jgi:hypothetical protein
MASSQLQRDFDYPAIEKALLVTDTDTELFTVIVNTPFTYKVKTTFLGLGILVLLLANKNNGTIDRIALSNNELAEGTKYMSVKKFEDIRIPLDYTRNIIAKAIKTGKWQSTTDWRYLFEPELSPEEARLNQAGGGIACSVVYPLIGARDGGAMIFSYYKRANEIGDDQHEFMQKYSSLAAQSLSR